MGEEGKSREGERRGQEQRERERERRGKRGVNLKNVQRMMSSRKNQNEKDFQDNSMFCQPVEVCD